PALQLSVRRADLLPGQEGQDRRHAQGRRLPVADAGVLALVRRRVQRRGVLRRRLVLRRQGRAGAGQRREPRLHPVPLPSNLRHQHRAKGMNREQARALVARVVAMSKADELWLSLSGGATTHLRFARNNPTTSGSYSELSITVTSSFGKRSASS